MRNHCIRRWAIVFGIFTSCCFVACGGGGGDSGPPPTGTTQIIGVVVAPNGQVAQAVSPGLFQWFASLLGYPEVALAQAQGLSPVQNARVFIFNVNSAGAPVGAPLATTTTDVDGIFTANVTGTALSPNLIVQAAAGAASAPVAINSPNVMNAPLVQSLVLVDPASELGTRKMITAGLSKFTRASAAGYVGLIQTFLIEFSNLVGVSIVDTMSNIQNDPIFASEVVPALVDVENSGQVDQSIASGTYTFFSYSATPDIGPDPMHRVTEHSTLTLDATTGTFSAARNEFGGQLKEVCTALCSRSVTLQSFTQQDFFEGLFFRTAGNRVFLTGEGRETVVAYANLTGTVAMFALHDGEGALGLGIAVKAGSGISFADLQTMFSFVDYGSILDQTGILNSPWFTPIRIRNGSGTASFSGPGAYSSFSGGDSGLRQEVTCTPVSSSCTITSALSSLSINTVAPGSIGTPFTVTSDGSVTLSEIGAGAISSDKNILVTTQADPLNPANVSLAMVVKQGAGMSNASLVGTYRAATFGDTFTASGQLMTNLFHVTVQNDGIGQQTVTNVATRSVTRSESCPPGGGCAIETVIQSPPPPGTSFMRNYNVSPEGILTLSGGNIPAGAVVKGAVSPDGSFVVITFQTDNLAGGTGQRLITLGIKQP